jgi:ATP-dependent DNA helicase RecG
VAASRTTRTSSPRSDGDPPKGRAPAGRPAAGVAAKRDRATGAAGVGGVAEQPVDPLAVDLARSGIPGAAGVARATRRLGIVSVGDLLFHLPRRYDDLRDLSTLGQLWWSADGSPVSVRARVRGIRVEPTFRRRVQRTIAYLADDTGEAEAVWFGRRYIERRVAEGDAVVVSGRAKRRGGTIVIDNPEVQKDEGELLHAGRIVPVYRLTRGLTAARLRAAIHGVLERTGDRAEEYLPPAIVRDEGLVGIRAALAQAHFPDDFAARDAALTRLAFDELLALQLGMVQRRRERQREAAVRIPVPAADDRAVRDAIVASLRQSVGPDVDLTADQAAAMDALRTGLAGSEPMVRLLQGDVGSGKTAVAAYGLAAVALGGAQGALLAPTDLLARQHLATLRALLAPLDLAPELLVGSLPAREAADVRGRLGDGTARIVVGTHALLQDAVSFHHLGLAIIDEQHRFGVAQRAALEAKAPGGAPHVLLMTATPIPRTLGRVLYADLDVSDLRTPPTGRVPVRTGIRRADELDGTWARVRDEAGAGHATFVVVPLIDEDEADAAVAAEAETERLRALLAPIGVGMVHGRMKPAARDAEMERFRAGGIDVLVGTTVVEVGVDVPRATMMVIEAADRFGLAQLHQLRGRVGRGSAASFCVLVSDAEEGTTARARLDAVRETRDGFALAEADFTMRGEGDVLGLAQSGLPHLRVASLQRDDHRELAVRARQRAEALLDAEGSLAGPDIDGLRRVLATGWLAAIASGEPADAA